MAVKFLLGVLAWRYFKDGELHYSSIHNNRRTRGSLCPERRAHEPRRLELEGVLCERCLLEHICRAVARQTYVDEGAELLGDFRDVRRGGFPSVEKPRECCLLVVCVCVSE